MKFKIGDRVILSPKVDFLYTSIPFRGGVICEPHEKARPGLYSVHMDDRRGESAVYYNFEEEDLIYDEVGNSTLAKVMREE